MLTRLIYFSLNKLPPENRSHQLKQLLGHAVTKNGRLGVTGGLVFNRNYFIQVLEGDRLNVSTLFTSITRDKRHSQIELVEMKATCERLFGTWSMGFASAPDAIRQLWEVSRINGPFNPKRLTSDQITHLVLGLIKNESFVSSRNVRSVSTLPFDNANVSIDPA